MENHLSASSLMTSSRDVSGGEGVGGAGISKTKLSILYLAARPDGPHDDRKIDGRCVFDDSLVCLGDWGSHATVAPCRGTSLRREVLAMVDSPLARRVRGLPLCWLSSAAQLSALAPFNPLCNIFLPVFELYPVLLLGE